MSQEKLTQNCRRMEATRRVLNSLLHQRRVYSQSTVHQVRSCCGASHGGEVANESKVGVVAGTTSAICAAEIWRGQALSVQPTV